MLLCGTKQNNMQTVTYQLKNQQSVIGFEKMVLIAITENYFYFKCYYTTVINGIKKVNIDIIQFDNDEFATISHDYTITSK
jgi:hypothetical protein